MVTLFSVSSFEVWYSSSLSLISMSWMLILSYLSLKVSSSINFFSSLSRSVSLLRSSSFSCFSSCFLSRSLFFVSGFKAFFNSLMSLDFSVRNCLFSDSFSIVSITIVSRGTPSIVCPLQIEFL